MRCEGEPRVEPGPACRRNQRRSLGRNPDEFSGAVAIFGLGYVCLPLAAAFAALHPAIGFDVLEEKLVHYRHAHDATGEVAPQKFAEPFRPYFPVACRIQHLAAPR